MKVQFLPFYRKSMLGDHAKKTIKKNILNIIPLFFLFFLQLLYVAMFHSYLICTSNHSVIMLQQSEVHVSFLFFQPEFIDTIAN